MKLEQNKSIQSFKGDEKLKLKEMLNRLKENLIKQNEHYYNLFLKPNDNMIKAINRFLVTHLKLKQEQIGTKQLKYILDKAQEQKEKVKKLMKGGI